MCHITALTERFGNKANVLKNDNANSRLLINKVVKVNEIQPMILDEANISNISNSLENENRFVNFDLSDNEILNDANDSHNDFPCIGHSIDNEEDILKNNDDLAVKKEFNLSQFLLEWYIKNNIT